MTATLDRPAPSAPAEALTWRDRLMPIVNGSGGWFTTLAITVIAGLLRFIRLDQPATNLTSKGSIAYGPGQIFDELYYACDAHSLMTFGVEHSAPNPGETSNFCHLSSTDPSFIVHPPVGKWLIGLGEQVFGFNTFGWRFASALFGTLTVLLLVRIGRRLTGSTLLGGLAGFLCAIDGLHFVQSRIATLDVFLCFFVTACFGALLLDRDDFRRRLARASQEELDGGGYLGRRPWRFVAGLLFGLALATKWSALYPLAVLLVLTVFWEAGARRSAGIRAPWRVTIRRTTLPFTGLLLLLPIAVYLSTWTGWFMTSTGYDRYWAVTNKPSALGKLFPTSMRSLWHYHWEMWHFHQTLTAKHPYQSHPLSWPFLGRPVSYYYPPNIQVGQYGCKTPAALSGCSREVLAIGTPAIWWLMIPVAIGLIARWISKRDWVSAALLLMMAVSILAWIPSDQKARTMFLFYALPSLPFLCLGIAVMAGWIMGEPGTNRRLWGAGGVGVYVSLATLNFVYFYPILAAVTLPYTDWAHRIWFKSWI